MFFLDGKCNSSRRLPLGYVGAIIDRPYTAPSPLLINRPLDYLCSMNRPDRQNNATL